MNINKPDRRFHLINAKTIENGKIDGKFHWIFITFCPR
jgi:hypothetical protein